ncbi:MAG: type II toxin-antitoxin system PemK/MazF family toxin [Verrucomicrobiales bacterium]|nr:type II toxin-antitoxin system PemK/MazF family toxin [Verrucomicrobiales bacterium]
MKAFEVFSWQPAGWNEPHPCVIVSHPDRAARKDPVEVVMCSTQRATRKPDPHEIILDSADGLDWATLCKCDVIYAAPRAELKNRRGIISENRRVQIVRTIIAAHGWGKILAS